MSQWRIVLLRPAQNYLERLPSHERKHVLDVLDQLANDPGRAPVKPLKGRPEWSLRIGDRRALVRVERESRTFFVTRIGPRGDVYK